MSISSPKQPTPPAIHATDRAAPAVAQAREAMSPKALWALAITSTAVFMVTLDNLVVTTAIPVLREDLHASLSGLQWTVNAYTLTFAVLLLTGAALGDRFGRRRLLAIGIAIFTAASAAAALAPSIVALAVAPAPPGGGGAIVMPLTLTILSGSVPAERRGLALGIWGGISGLAVAFGPLVGGAIVSGFSWHWIFWLNVPIGLALAPLILLRLDETRAPGWRCRRSVWRGSPPSRRRRLRTSSSSARSCSRASAWRCSSHPSPT